MDKEMAKKVSMAEDFSDTEAAAVGILRDLKHTYNPLGYSLIPNKAFKVALEFTSRVFNPETVPLVSVFGPIGTPAFRGLSVASQMVCREAMAFVVRAIQLRGPQSSSFASRKCFLPEYFEIFKKSVAFLKYHGFLIVKERMCATVNPALGDLETLDISMRLIYGVDPCSLPEIDTNHANFKKGSPLSLPPRPLFDLQGIASPAYFRQSCLGSTTSSHVSGELLEEDPCVLEPPYPGFSYAQPESPSSSLASGRSSPSTPGVSLEDSYSASTHSSSQTTVDSFCSSIDKGASKFGYQNTVKNIVPASLAGFPNFGHFSALHFPGYSPFGFETPQPTYLLSEMARHYSQPDPVAHTNGFSDLSHRWSAPISKPVNSQPAPSKPAKSHSTGPKLVKKRSRSEMRREMPDTDEEEMVDIDGPTGIIDLIPRRGRPSTKKMAGNWN